MRLNVGCGSHKADDWYNIDIFPECEPDLVADICVLDLPAGSVDSVYLGHVLEHIELCEIEDVLYNVWRMLAPGGTVCAVGPDLDRVNRIADPQLWEYLAKGGDEERSDHWITHKWECTERKLLQLMLTSFPSAQPIVLGRLHGMFPLVSLVDWQCAVIARKPAW